MPFQFDGSTQTGTAGTDYLFGINDGPNHIQNGSDGNDFIVGDFGDMRIDSEHTGNDTIAGAFNIDGSIFWYTDASPFMSLPGTPHTTIHLNGTGEAEFFAVTIGAGETITVDIDFAEFDTVVQILDAGGNQLAADDDGPPPAAGDVGDLSSLHSFLTYSPTDAGVYYIRISQHNGANINEGVIGGTFNGGDIAVGNETLVHVSVTGHAATGTSTRFDEGGNDTLNGGNGNDQMFGMSGNDRFVASDNDGNDYMDGGDGFDFADYFFVTTGVTVDLSNTAAQNTGGAGIDTLVSIEEVYGSNIGNDVLTAAATGSDLSGWGGDDTLTGGTGNDFLLGGKDRTLSMAMPVTIFIK